MLLFFMYKMQHSSNHKHSHFCFGFRVLESEYGIHCNMTLLFNFYQASCLGLPVHLFLRTTTSSTTLSIMLIFITFPVILGSRVCRGWSDPHLSICGSNLWLVHQKHGSEVLQHAGGPWWVNQPNSWII